MTPNKPKQLLFAVLDDQAPSQWAPWRSAFSTIQQVVHGDGLLLDEAERAQTHFQVGMLLHAPAELRRRSSEQMKLVVGVVVDGISYVADPARASAILDEFAFLCNAVASSGADGWSRRVGFYVLIAVRGALDDRFARCLADLRKAAGLAFGGPSSLIAYPIEGDDYLPSAIQALEVHMADRYRQWRRDHGE